MMPRFEGSKTLSVIMLCYNHEAFIVQALRSVFSQAGILDVELIVADDCSSDGSEAEITKTLMSGSPPWLEVRYHRRPSRMGMNANMLAALKEARGEFIAFLEGDDYWCNENKLRIQVEILSRRAAVYVCAHKTLIKEGDAVFAKEWRTDRMRVEFDASEYMERLMFHTSSIMMRRLHVMPHWLLHVKQLDQAIVLLGASPASHAIAIIDENMSVYRRHRGGITQSAGHRNRKDALWSHMRIICGVGRDCSYYAPKWRRRKILELHMQLRLVEATFASRMAMLVRHPGVAARLARYALLSP